LATSTEPPTHPLFAHQHPTKTKLSCLQPSENLSFLPQNPYIPFPLYNPLQMLPTLASSYSSPHVLEQTLISPVTKLVMSTIGDFLKQVDEHEGTGDYYQGFLTELEQQRISVRILPKLSDNEFEKCEIDTIGARQTLRDYAIKYSSAL